MFNIRLELGFRSWCTPSFARARRNHDSSILLWVLLNGSSRGIISIEQSVILSMSDVALHLRKGRLLLDWTRDGRSMESNLQLCVILSTLRNPGRSSYRSVSSSLNDNLLYKAVTLLSDWLWTGKLNHEDLETLWNERRSRAFLSVSQLIACIWMGGNDGNCFADKLHTASKPRVPVGMGNATLIHGIYVEQSR